MTFREFEEKYNSLSDIHKHIVFHTLRRLEHKNEHKGIKKYTINIEKRIKEIRKEKGIKYQELFDKANQESANGAANYKTYQAMLKKNRVNSYLFPAVLKVLDVKPHEVMEFSAEYYENWRIISADSVDLKWLYSSLSETNQKAVEYLVAALIMAENHPEVFAMDIESDE